MGEGALHLMGVPGVLLDDGGRRRRRRATVVRNGYGVLNVIFIFFRVLCVLWLIVVYASFMYVYVCVLVRLLERWWPPPPPRVHNRSGGINVIFMFFGVLCVVWLTVVSVVWLTVVSVPLCMSLSLYTYLYGFLN